jgi:hypothetical protein
LFQHQPSLFFGSTCTESVEGLASLYISLLCISTLGLIILSTRAALFNPVIRGRRSKRREKEFADYKVFMSKFYDTRNWELDWIPDVGVDEQNEQCHSDETRSTSTVSPCHSHETREEEDDCTIDKRSTVSASEIPQIQPAVACSEDNDDDDSYDSTYSVDEQAIDDLRSTSTGSMFSLAYLKKRIESMKGLGTLSKTESHDEIVSSFSSTSVLSNFIRRKHWNATRKGDALGLYPPTRNGGEWNQSDDENDSTDGVLMTPPAMRNSMRSRRPHMFRRGEDDPPIDSEVEPLSPPEQPADSGCFTCENQDSASTNNFASTFRRSSVYR